MEDMQGEPHMAGRATTPRAVTGAATVGRFARWVVSLDIGSLVIGAESTSFGEVLESLADVCGVDWQRPPRTNAK